MPFKCIEPDITRNKCKDIGLTLADKIDLFVDVLKGEISKAYYQFQVIIYQIFYDDDYEIYQNVKYEDITSKVCI